MHFGGLYLKVNDSIIAMANRGVAKYKNTLLYFNNTNPTCTNLQYFCLNIFVFYALRFIHHNHRLIAMCVMEKQ
jgi:hypothetical protein